MNEENKVNKAGGMGEMGGMGGMGGIYETLNDRGKRYGSFKEHARVAQNIKTSMQGSPNWDDLSDSQREALDMVAHKVGRILNGDANYVDSWRDCVGYLQLEVDILLSKHGATDARVDIVKCVGGVWETVNV